MAGRAMNVAVPDGDLVAPCNLGLPFSVSYQLAPGEGFEASYQDALWTIESSAS